MLTLRPAYLHPRVIYVGQQSSVDGMHIAGQQSTEVLTRELLPVEPFGFERGKQLPAEVEHLP